MEQGTALQQRELNSLLAFYPEEQINKLLEHKDKLDKIIKAFDKMSAVAFSSTVVMTCSSYSCPYKDVCILLKNDLAPSGSACPVEKKIVSELECDIVNSLKIDRNDPIEMELLWDLIDLKLIDMRSSGYMKDGSVTQKIETKMGPSVSIREEISPALEIKLDLKRVKHSIIDSFVATRRAKKKYGMNNDANTLEDMIMSAINNKRDNDSEDSIS